MTGCSTELGGGRSPFAGSVSESGPFRPEGGVDFAFCCEALTGVAESTAWSVSPPAVYQRMVDAIAVAASCSQVHLHLISDGGDRLVRTAYHAAELSTPGWSDRMDLDVGRLRWMISTGLPLVTDFVNPREGDRIPDEAIAQGARTAVSIPLKAGSDFVGACTVVYVDDLEWDEERLAYLMRIGRIVAMAVKRMQSHKKASELLVLDERKRLGIEMHNSVSSVLGSIALTAAAAVASCDEGDGASMRDDLERLERQAGRAIRVLRNEAMALRIPFAESEDLVEAFTGLVDGFRSNWGLEVDFTVDPADGSLGIPRAASLQLVRILNECFSNIIHHAKASRVEVALSKSDGLVTLTVEDDGKGFDVDAVPASCLGLKIMRERAAAAGGNFAVVSGAGGTTVLVDIPC